MRPSSPVTRNLTCTPWPLTRTCTEWRTGPRSTTTVTASSSWSSLTRAVTATGRTTVSPWTCGRKQAGVSPTPGSYKVTVRDNSPQPTVSFSRTSVSLTEGSQTTTGNPVNVEIGVPPKMTAPTGMTTLTNVIQFTTSPAGAAVVGDCVAMGDADVIALTLGSAIEAEADEDDTYMVGEAGDIGVIPANYTIGIEACGDMSSYNDEMVTFSFVATTLTGEPMGYGSVAAGPNLVVTVQSEGEAVPTVSFATTSIDIAEGMHQHGRDPCRRHARRRGRVGHGQRERRRHALAVAGRQHDRCRRWRDV